MALPVEIDPLLLASKTSAYSVSKSLRFRSSASAYLNRTPASASNRTTWTWSGWVKRGKLGATQRLFASVSSNGSLVGINSSDQLQMSTGDGSTAYNFASTAVYRDPSAWYHIVIVTNTASATTTQTGTTTDRQQMWVNGVQLSAFSTNQVPTQNFSGVINSTNAHYIGQDGGSASYLDGYMAEVNFVDGQALTPSSFGAYDTNGVWQPIKYSGTYGTNGFYLTFGNTTSTTTLGYDTSGNSNNWTTNNISLTAGSTYDSMTDSPTVTSATVANYATLNPLRYNTSGTISQANLNYSNGSGANQAIATSTIGISTGKFYWEGTITQIFNDTSRHKFGFASSTSSLSADLTFQIAAITAGATAVGQVVMIAIDFDAGKIWYGAQGVWVSGGSPSTGANPYQTFTPSTYNYLYPSVNVYAGSDGTSAVAVNFGQRPFSYTSPTGYSALNTYNLPTPSITNGAKYFAATTYTGNLTGQTITNGGNNTIGTTFQPDLVWVKSRSAATDHKLTDAVRGATKALISDTTGAETTDATGLTAFASNGFTLGASTVYNNTGATYAGWQWLANGAGVSNTNGSITSTVSANTTAGFSIVTYTGTGAAATIGHGLGVAPSFIIIKNRQAANSWAVYHVSVGANQQLLLNSTNAISADTQGFTATPSTTVFSVGTGAAMDTNQTTGGGQHVAYCWAAVSGYSAFGSYTGNGSTDGPFVYTGFRPRFVLFKRTDAVNSWLIYDTSRSPYNADVAALYPNTSAAETTDDAIDYLSNGFKMRGTGNLANTSGGTYIYAAFAENPFNSSRAR